MNHIQVYVGADEYLDVPYLPERVLVAAILERAARDLSEIVEHHWRLQAIQWFTATELEKDDRFSFHDCISVLSLSSGQLEYLYQKVAQAEAYEIKRRAEAKALGKQISTYQMPCELESKRRSRRTFVSYVSKGMRRAFRSEDGTILRKYG